MLEPTMYLLPPGSDTEVNCKDITSGLEFLGDDSDPLLTNTYGTDDGLDGATYAFQQRTQNVVNAKFLLHFTDGYDFKMKKHTLAKFFVQKGLYRIRTDAEPAIVKYVYAGNFTITPFSDGSNDAVFTIPFDNPSGLKYSLGYSDDVMDFNSATVKPDASKDDTAAIASVRVKTIPTKDGDGVEREIKLADKLKALELLGKRYGLFTDNVNVSGEGVVQIVDDVPDKPAGENSKAD